MQFSRWGTEQPRRSFGLIIVLFPTKIARGDAHSDWGKSLPHAMTALDTTSVQINGY